MCEYGLAGGGGEGEAIKNRVRVLERRLLLKLASKFARQTVHQLHCFVFVLPNKLVRD